MSKKTSSQLDSMAFTEVLAKATRKAGIRVERSEALALFVVVRGSSLRCNLATAYNAYRQSPDRLDDIVAAHLAALAKVPAVPAPPNAAELRTHLLPMLNQRSRLASLQQPGLPAPLHRTFPGNLVVTYVFDQPETMAYINSRMLEMAGATALSVDELHVLAVENLRKRTNPKGWEVHGVGDQRMIISKELDGYTACRVLLPELLDEWAGKVSGRLLLGIPNRDFLIGFGDRDPQHVATMVRQVRIDAGKMARPLTSSLLVWREGQLREFQPLH
jgi:hypothetical protein